jgi:hypothetical protein
MTVHLATYNLAKSQVLISNDSPNTGRPLAPGIWWRPALVSFLKPFKTALAYRILTLSINVTEGRFFYLTGN